MSVSLNKIRPFFQWYRLEYLWRLWFGFWRWLWNFGERFSPFGHKVKELVLLSFLPFPKGRREWNHVRCWSCLLRRSCSYIILVLPKKLVSFIQSSYQIHIYALSFLPLSPSFFFFFPLWLSFNYLKIICLLIKKCFCRVRQTFPNVFEETYSNANTTNWYHNFENLGFDYIVPYVNILCSRYC